jgi:hypothetical protein
MKSVINNMRITNRFCRHRYKTLYDWIGKLAIELDSRDVLTANGAPAESSGHA